VPEYFMQTGNFYEDFAIGQIYRHQLGRTIGEADNRWFSLLTMNTNQLHFNADYAKKSEHGQELVNSGLTVALVLGISVADISQNAIANLGWTEIRLTAPVFVGDTLYGESIITGLRPSASRPHAGIVTCATRGINQRGEEVLDFERTFLVWRSDADAILYFPEPTTPITPRRPGAMTSSAAGPKNS
jgi:itaconyl-CoA hydratase